jgi:pilus assembly protein CpaB
VLIRTEGGANGESYSDVILQNMKVLAIDQLVGQQVEQASAAVKAVTLEVAPEEAQKLLLATNIGRLSLILRQPGEAGANAGRRITEKDLADIKIPVAPPPEPDLNTSKVVIMRGGKREEYAVRRDVKSSKP